MNATFSSSVSACRRELRVPSRLLPIRTGKHTAAYQWHPFDPSREQTVRLCQCHPPNALRPIRRVALLTSNSSLRLFEGATGSGLILRR